jgi:dihydrolipoamide dehydrogenase
VSETRYDIIVIGAGPGGYVAAIRAAQLGLKTAIVERQYMGGVCLNVGCIPTKALLHTADLLEEMHESRRFGILTNGISLDWSVALKNKDQVVRKMTQGVAFLMKKNKIDVHTGTGKLVSPTSVQVTAEDGKQTTLETQQIILAVGGNWKRGIPQIGAVVDEDRILSSTGALDLKEIPKSLIVVGAGAVGCEFASMYRSFGTEVTIIEVLPRILRLEDEEVSAEVMRAFTKRGIKVLTSANLKRVDRSESQVVATLTDKDGKEQKIAAERMLLGLGAPLPSDSEALGLNALGVALDERGYIKVNEMMQTNVPSVYAIGDCVPTIWLAHVASAEGILAVEHIAGHHPQPIDYDKVPNCTYCNPEVASIGLTEAKARERGYDVKIGKFPFSANSKATILGQTIGFVKIVSDTKYDEVLGVHIVGPRATELIAEGGVALSHEATSESLMRTIHAHPTLYEALGEAQHAAAEGAAIHI